MTRRRRLTERRNWALTTAVGILKPPLAVLTKQDWVGGEHLPERGGAVVAANHVSHADPLTFAHFVYDHGRIPRFLAKAAVLDIPVLGRIIKGTGQIPVFRQTSDASQAFTAAVAAVQRGEIVVVYPEGTITRQPDLWPMRGKTGAARIALTAGVPVIPVAQWGPQDILYPYAKRPHLVPRHTVHIRAGAPVELDDYRDQRLTPALLHEATERIMEAITALLEEIRGEQAPKERYDPKREGIAEIGNPHVDYHEHPHPEGHNTEGEKA